MAGRQNLTIGGRVNLSIAGYESVEVFIGLDVGKGEHHAVALDRLGARLFDKPLPNDEHRMRALISDLKAHGRVLPVVDQPATIGGAAGRGRPGGGCARGLLARPGDATDRGPTPRRGQDGCP